MQSISWEMGVNTTTVQPWIAMSIQSTEVKQMQNTWKSTFFFSIHPTSILPFISLVLTPPSICWTLQEFTWFITIILGMSPLPAALGKNQFSFWSNLEFADHKQLCLLWINPACIFFQKQIHIILHDAAIPVQFGNWKLTRS